MFRILFFAAVAWLGCATSDGASPGQKPSQSMKDLLSADLIPEILGTDAFFLVKISKARLEMLPGSEPALEIGTITFKVLDILRPGPVAAAATIETPAHRVADLTRRAKSNQDQWNNLNLEPGTYLILACRPTIPPIQWAATAAIPVTGTGDPKVAAVRRALEIEASPPDQQPRLLKEALEDPQEFLRFYAVASLSRGTVVPKPTGAMLIEQAIRSGKVAPLDRLELGRGLAAFFDKQSKAGPSNAAALAGLCEGLLAETDIQRQLEWARLIFSCFMVEFDPDLAVNRSIRKELQAKIPPEIKSRTEEALTALLRRDLPEDERDIVRQLIEAWRTGN
jgi:hypothetical protein